MLTCPSSTIPNLILFPTRTPVPLRRRNHLGGFFYDDFSNHHKAAFLRGSTCGPRFGFMPGMVPQPDEVLIKDLVDRAEGILYTIADAAVSSSDATNAADSATGKQSGDWLSGITYCMESVLKVLKDGLAALHVPYTYGFAIILLTLIVKAATFPLTRKQVESAMAMRSLQPQVKAIQERFAGDQEKIQLETARLYKLAGINPLAGCLPTLATIPVWIGLYRALSHVADEGLLSEGFFFIPSLAGPTTTAARQNGSGISWLFPFVDGNPPLGWSDTLAYLVLPVLLVITQYISVQIMQSSARNDPNLKNSQLMSKILPLMIGYFSLSVPSGLSLYWLTNNILSTGQQVWLQKLGGAKNPVQQYNYDFIKEDQSQTRKSPSVLNSSKIEAKQEEKLTPEGLRPGERFKQIKEEEARRRREREEEKRKAEEAALKGKQIANEGPNNEANLFERGNGANSSTAGVVLNGSISGLDTSNDEKIASLISSEEIEVSSNNEISERDERIFSRNEISVRNEQDSASNEVSMIDEQHFHEEKEKEAVEVYDGSDHGRDRQ